MASGAVARPEALLFPFVKPEGIADCSSPWQVLYSTLKCGRLRLMSDTAAVMDSDSRLVVDRLVHKGKGVLELCLERNKVLCVKGFIDCQIERGGDYVRVVEQMVDFIGAELGRTHDRTRRAILLDLQGYASMQLEALQPELHEAAGES